MSRLVFGRALKLFLFGEDCQGNCRCYGCKRHLEVELILSYKIIKRVRVWLLQFSKLQSSLYFVK